MKKLGKLTLNEMQDYVPLNSEEQMAMKGGMTPYHWAKAIYIAWTLSKEIMETINGSGGSTTPSCPPGSTHFYEPDSVKLGSGTIIYHPKLVCVPCK